MGTYVRRMMMMMIEAKDKRGRCDWRKHSIDHTTGTRTDAVRHKSDGDEQANMDTML